MQILADENVDRPIVVWLRDNGHDVIEVTAAAPGATDIDLIHRSRNENRVLMTFDRDIGRIIRSDETPHPGVIYLRIRGAGPKLWESFKRVWPKVEPVAAGHFVTVHNQRIRRRPLPLVR